MKNSQELKELGLKIKAQRKLAGLTQEELAWESELGFRTIQRIESGDNAASVDAIFSIAKALKISPEELFKL